MRLTLTVVSSQPGGASQGTSRAFEGDQATIGRGAACDWILPDPLNHLSKRHCVVAGTGDGFTLTDTSTNGVFVNGSPDPLGNGNKIELADGDRLALGDYVLEARIAAAELRSQAAAAPAEDDPFGIAEFRLDRPPPAAAPPAAPPPPLPEAPFEPFAPEPLSSGREPLIPENFDLLGEDDPLKPDPFARNPAPEWRGAPVSDHVAAERGAFSPPRVEGGAIPENWLEEEGPRPVPVAAPPVRAAQGGDLLAAFLAGAQLPPQSLAQQDEAALMRALGRAYREAVLGLAEILRMRTMVKSEFRIEQTRIGAVGNNPLKFLSEPEAIVAAMIGQASPGFQEASAALRDGIRDLKAHQLAMLSAMQVALTKLLAQFDPDALKLRLEGRSLLDAVVPGARKAKYWEVFEQSYKAIASELGEDFHGTFGKAFAEAYEDEMRRL